MTSDQIQDKQIRIKARIAPATTSYGKRYAGNSKDGIELTRMQRFLDGGYDIFDVLENHAANTQMKIKTNNVLDEQESKALSDTNLFKSLLTRLREQMRDMI